MSDKNISARSWLRQNNYSDVAELIEHVMNGWQQKGTSTRRSWWDVLAGGKNGEPRVVEGVTFPVLRAAQLRKGIPVSDNALCRNTDEVHPLIRVNGRWSCNDTKKGDKSDG